MLSLEILRKNKEFLDLFETIEQNQGPGNPTGQILEWTFGNFHGARDSLVILFILSLMELKDWQSEKVINQIANKAYCGNYQGAWLEVQEYLEIQELSTEKFLQKYLQRHSVNELFGNLIPQARIRFKYFAKTRDLSVYQEDTRKVTRKIRHRGYRDHGTLRLPHEIHGDPIPPKSREDKRGRVANQLVKLKYTDSP